MTNEETFPEMLDPSRYETLTVDKDLLDQLDHPTIKVLNQPGWIFQGLGKPVLNKDGDVVKDRSHLVCFKRLISPDNPKADHIIETHDMIIDDFASMVFERKTQQ